MKLLTNVSRWLVGLLFIFSGLVKANDPLGLSYKMQEFFEVWGWHGLDQYTLTLSITMNVLEIVAGVALLIGWQLKKVIWLLLLLILFFTFLTGYALFSGKIATCGCFGDCIPLTPAQSFAKDLLLLVLIVVLLLGLKHMRALFKSVISWILILTVTVLCIAMQFQVLKHLPYVDCLPYKTGNNILDQMKTPEGAIADSFSLVFTYTKNGKVLEFDQSGFPDDFDSTYVYVDRSDKLVKKGNGLKAKIVDFSLQTPAGIDTTEAVFAQTNPYLLLFAKDFTTIAIWRPTFEKVAAACLQKKIPVLLVTADVGKAIELFPRIPVLKCDATVLKTAARATPTYFMMQGAVVKGKHSYADSKQVLQKVVEGW